MKIKLSLRTKLIVFSLMIALIPLGIAGWNMISLTKNELKSTVNDELLGVANGLAAEIDELYIYTWRAPLLLISNALENPYLGIPEKLSLLEAGIHTVTDVVALQLSLTGMQPVLAIQQEFSQQLLEKGIDPAEKLRLTPTSVEDLRNLDRISIGDLIYIPEVGSWLVTLSIPLKLNVGGSGLSQSTIFSARINLSRLCNRLKEHQFTRTGLIFIVDSSGTQILSDHAINLGNFEIIQKVKNLLSTDNHTMGVVPYTKPSGKKVLGAYAIPSAFNWGIVVEKKADDAYLIVSKMTSSLLLWVVFGIGIAAIGAVSASYGLTHSLRKLSKAADELGHGDLNIRVSGKMPSDEIGQLANTFNHMVEELNRYIKELTETTRAKERVESEIQLGRGIQQSFIPQEFPELPDIELWGRCDPAREVGGDFFDYFIIDDRHVAMFIGDVSGKGVPAALFMAMSRTLIRMIGNKVLEPDIVLQEFNNKLKELEEGANLFVTLFYGIYDRETKVFSYSTAGHNMPYVKRGRLGEFEQLPRMKTMVAGIIDTIPLEKASITLTTGDIVYLYTDGMTEAINDSQVEFGKVNLQNLLNSNIRESAQKLSQNTLDHVRKFHENQPQFDDMTVFVLKLKN